MKFDLSKLEKLRETIRDNYIFLIEQKKVCKTKLKKEFTYQYYNQMCACIIRIRDTTKYVENFEFQKENKYEEAFDFYEFINCLSIIKESIEILFNIFDKKINEYYPKVKSFKISNHSNKSDISFFNFIRSAACVHPTNTTAHNKITKHKFEVYPYASWINTNLSVLQNDIPSNAEIQLLAWNCKTKGNYKKYYLVIDEFNFFLANLIECIDILLKMAIDKAKDYRSTLKFSRIKKLDDFSNASEYCLYLRKKIIRKLKSDDCSDGGLLLASNILSNNLIGDKFKKYILIKINNLVTKMKTDITTIEYDEIFIGLLLSKIIHQKEIRIYLSKIDEYLNNKANYEISSNNFIDFKVSMKKNIENYSNAEWAVYKLANLNDSSITNLINKANYFSDLYELILEKIYEETIYQFS